MQVPEDARAAMLVGRENSILGVIFADAQDAIQTLAADTDSTQALTNTAESLQRTMTEQGAALIAALPGTLTWDHWARPIVPGRILPW